MFVRENENIHLGKKPHRQLCRGFSHQAKGNHRENGGGFQPRFFPRALPKHLGGKKGENCFLSKITCENRGWWPHFPYGFPLAWPPNIFWEFWAPSHPGQRKETTGKIEGFSSQHVVVPMDFDPENSQGQGRQNFWWSGGILPMHLWNFGPQAIKHKETIGKMGGFSSRFFHWAFPKDLWKTNKIPEERNHREDWGVFKPACCCPTFLGGSSGENLGCKPLPPLSLWLPLVWVAWVAASSQWILTLKIPKGRVAKFLVVWEGGPPNEFREFWAPGNQAKGNHRENGGFSIQIFPLSSPQGPLKKKVFFRPWFPPRSLRRSLGKNLGWKPPILPTVSFSLGGLGALGGAPSPSILGIWGFRSPRPRKTIRRMGGVPNPDFSPELSPKTLGKKRVKIVFSPKLPAKRFGENLGWWPHFPCGFPLAWLPNIFWEFWAPSHPGQIDFNLGGLGGCLLPMD